MPEDGFAKTLDGDVRRKVHAACFETYIKTYFRDWGTQVGWEKSWLDINNHFEASLQYYWNLIERNSIRIAIFNDAPPSWQLRNSVQALRDNGSCTCRLYAFALSERTMVRPGDRTAWCRQRHIRSNAAPFRHRGPPRIVSQSSSLDSNSAVRAANSSLPLAIKPVLPSQTRSRSAPMPMVTIGTPAAVASRREAVSFVVVARYEEHPGGEKLLDQPGAGNAPPERHAAGRGPFSCICGSLMDFRRENVEACARDLARDGGPKIEKPTQSPIGLRRKDGTRKWRGACRNLSEEILMNSMMDNPAASRRKPSWHPACVIFSK